MKRTTILVILVISDIEVFNNFSKEME